MARQEKLIEGEEFETKASEAAMKEQRRQVDRDNCAVCAVVFGFLRLPLRPCSS